MDRRRAQAYRVLGIPADSGRDAVVHAYRRLARATHPDVSAEPDAADRFATIAAAYELVSRGSAPASISVRVHRSGPGDEGGARGNTPVGDPLGARFLVWSWPTAMEPPLMGSRDRAPIVAGPVSVRPPRGLGDPGVRGG